MPPPDKISVTINGHRTSISLERPFSAALRAIAKREKKSVAAIVQMIDRQKAGDDGLSSAVRIWILEYYMKRANLESGSPARRGAGEHDSHT